MHRFSILTAVALAAVLGVTACGDSDDESSAPPATVTQQAASSQGGDKLDASDAQVLSDASKTVAQYCNGHKASTGELTGAVATIESLIQIDPEALDASGKTVKQVTTSLASKLRQCGASSAAKRLAAATG